MIHIHFLYFLFMYSLIDSMAQIFSAAIETDVCVKAMSKLSYWVLKKCFAFCINILGIKHRFVFDWVVVCMPSVKCFIHVHLF